jgi:hypothetical protein
MAEILETNSIMQRSSKTGEKIRNVEFVLFCFVLLSCLALLRNARQRDERIDHFAKKENSTQRRSTITKRLTPLRQPATRT